MLSVSDRDNVGQIFQGFHSIPKPYNDESCLKIKMWNLNGTMTAPWFGGDYVEEYYEEDREFFMVLELPKDIRDQVGGGSLFIDLNVDTRDEVSWGEEVRRGPMPNFTLHSTKKNWTEAESFCQKEGGHLASVTSEEVNQVVTDVAAGNDVWLGGTKVRGEWTWSDHSSWSYNKSWDPLDYDCVDSFEGEWYESPCSKRHYFICQKPNTWKGATATSLAYTRDQLNFSNFTVWYKYKFADKQVLESWKDKRMTGFRLSWRIDNPHLIAIVRQVGRSIQTPPFKDSDRSPKNGVYNRVQRIYFLFNFYLAHTFFSVFFNSKNNLFSYIF